MIDYDAKVRRILDKMAALEARPDFNSLHSNAFNVWSRTFHELDDIPLEALRDDTLALIAAL